MDCYSLALLISISCFRSQSLTLIFTVWKEKNPRVPQYITVSKKVRRVLFSQFSSFNFLLMVLIGTISQKRCISFSLVSTLGLQSISLQLPVCTVVTAHDVDIKTIMASIMVIVRFMLFSNVICLQTQHLFSIINWQR